MSEQNDIIRGSVDKNYIQEIIKHPTIARTGRPASPYQDLWAKLDLMNAKQGDTITLPNSQNASFSYLRMKISRFGLDTGSAFKTRKGVDGSLVIVCLAAPDMGKLGAAGSDSDRPTAIPVWQQATPLPSTETKQPDPNQLTFETSEEVKPLVYEPEFKLEPVIEVKATLEAGDYCAICTNVPCSCDHHPTKAELHAWLNSQKKGWSYVYVVGTPGCTTSPQLIEKWANELACIGASLTPDGNAVDMEYIE